MYGGEEAALPKVFENLTKCDNFAMLCLMSYYAFERSWNCTTS